MTINKMAPAIAVIGATTVFFMLADAARADVEILESTVPSYSPGSTLGDGTRLSIPAGATVRVLITKTNTTKTLKGPYAGTAAAYKEQRNWRNWIKKPGGKDPVPGGTRDVRSANKPKPQD